MCGEQAKVTAGHHVFHDPFRKCPRCFSGAFWKAAMFCMPWKCFAWGGDGENSLNTAPSEGSWEGMSRGALAGPCLLWECFGATAAPLPPWRAGRSALYLSAANPQAQPSVCRDRTRGGRLASLCPPSLGHPSSSAPSQGRSSWELRKWVRTWPVSPRDSLPLLLPPPGLRRPSLWQANGNDPSPYATAEPPTLITAAAQRFVSIGWHAARLLPAAPQPPQVADGPRAGVSSPAAPAPGALRHVGAVCLCTSVCLCLHARGGVSVHVPVSVLLGVSVSARVCLCAHSGGVSAGKVSAAKEGARHGQCEAGGAAGGQKRPAPAPPWVPPPPACRGVTASSTGTAASRERVPGGDVRGEECSAAGWRRAGEAAAGRRNELGLCLCAVSGTMSSFSALHGRSVLSCRAVETSTLQQERLQAIAVSPLGRAGGTWLLAPCPGPKEVTPRDPRGLVLHLWTRGRAGGWEG